MTRDRIPNLAHEKLRRLVDEQRFDECLREFQRLRKARPLHLNELVQMGRCILLSSGEPGLPEDAEGAYRQALDIDSEYVPALLELAWYLYACEDDASAALKVFDRARALAEENLKEAEKGREECLEEIRHFELDDA